MTRIIKRYANRKLYDTKQSSYVTLDQIQKMIEQGEDLRILDNKTKEDITNPTLAQIIFERQKSKDKMLPLSTLRAIIQSGDDFSQKIQAPIEEVKEQLQHRSSKLEDESVMFEFLESTKRSLEQMQHKIDARLTDTVGHLTQVPALEHDIFAINLRLRAVEKSVNRIERLLKSHRTETSNISTDLSGISYDPHQNLPQ